MSNTQIRNVRLEKFKKKFKGVTKFIFLKVPYGLLLTLIGLYLAYKANLYAETSIVLTQTDSTQQQQIEQLKQILIGQDSQLKSLSQISDNSQRQIDLINSQNQSIAEQNKLLMNENYNIAKVSENTSKSLLLFQKNEEKSDKESADIYVYNLENLLRTVIVAQDTIGNARANDLKNIRYDSIFTTSELAGNRLRQLINSLNSIITSQELNPYLKINLRAKQIFNSIISELKSTWIVLTVYGNSFENRVRALDQLITIHHRLQDLEALLIQTE